MPVAPQVDLPGRDPPHKAAVPAGLPAGHNKPDFDKVSAQITDDFRSGRIGKVSLEVPKQA